MGRPKKFDYQAVIENRLAENPKGFALDELLQYSELKVDRSTLFRHLTRLIERGRAERVGNARASRYRLSGVAPIAADPGLPDASHPALQTLPQRLEQGRTNEAPRTADNDPQLRVEPDSIPVEALKHGAVVKKAVRRIVQEWKRCSQANLEIYLSLLVAPEQLDEVAAIVRSELTGLHEANLHRYELSPTDFSGFIPPEDFDTRG